jgi:hypothetical protein
VGWVLKRIRQPKDHSSEPTQTFNMANSAMSTVSTIQRGVQIFNQGRDGSQTIQTVNRISGPQGLNMSGPNNHRNDLGFRAGNAISNAFRPANNAFATGGGQGRGGRLGARPPARGGRR